MKDYYIKDVVCDTGLFLGDELLIVFNSRAIAVTVLELLKQDYSLGAFNLLEL